jgi:hypothetical protein
MLSVEDFCSCPMAANEADICSEMRQPKGGIQVIECSSRGENKNRVGGFRYGSKPDLGSLRNAS